jgi:hypothetical protein
MRKTIETPNPRGERNMSVKVPRGTMNGETHVGESSTGWRYQNAIEVIILQI